MLARASQCSAYDHSSLGADHQSAGDPHQLATALALQLRPQLVRATYARHVQPVLEVGIAYNATVALGRAERATRSELFASECAHTAHRQVKKCGTSHRTQADYDHVIAALSSHAAVSCIDSWNSGGEHS